MPARRFAELRVPLTVSVVDLDTGELLLFGAGGTTARWWTCSAPAARSRSISRRSSSAAGAAATAASAACCRSRRRPGSRPEPVVAVDVGPGFDMAAGAPPTVPPVVRAHDEAVGTLMAAHTAAQLAALAGASRAGRR